ncbi:MAG: DUF1579 family protein [Planctomycetota bacterium]
MLKPIQMTLALPFVLLGCFCCNVQAQFPAPEPTEAHEILAAEAGTWDCKVKMFLAGPDQPPAEFTGVENNSLVNGGLHLKVDFQGEFNGKFEGSGLFGFNPKMNKYEGIWGDSSTMAPNMMTGTYDKEKKTLTYTSRVQDEVGNEIPQRQVTTFIDEKTKKMELFVLSKENGEVQTIKIMEMMSTKR